METLLAIFFLGLIIWFAVGIGNTRPWWWTGKYPPTPKKDKYKKKV